MTLVDPKLTENFKKTMKVQNFSLSQLIIDCILGLPKFLGSIVKTSILLFVMAHFVPELRDVLPEFFIFIEDGVFKVINWAFGQVNGLIF